MSPPNNVNVITFPHSMPFGGESLLAEVAPRETSAASSQMRQILSHARECLSRAAPERITQCFCFRGAATARYVAADWAPFSEKLQRLSH